MPTPTYFCLRCRQKIEPPLSDEGKVPGNAYYVLHPDFIEDEQRELVGKDLDGLKQADLKKMKASKVIVKRDVDVPDPKNAGKTMPINTTASLDTADDMETDDVVIYAVVTAPVQKTALVHRTCTKHDDQIIW
jgi:hypothetical protein